MTAYFVMGIITAAWAVVLTGFGLTRENFPPSGAGLRAIVAITALLVAGTLTALFVTTKKEHPREEAAKKAQEPGFAKGFTPYAPPSKKKSAPAAGGTIKASEKEFSISLAGGKALKPGGYTIDVSNTGKIQHDLAVQGNGIKQAKTPLIDPGKSGTLKVDLQPGKYTFFCTVPGHEQSGMKVDVTVQ